MEFTGMALLVYERLCWEFLISLCVDWGTPYKRWPVYIRFRFFNRDFKTNLTEFDWRLRLPHARVWIVRHENFNVQSFWCEITWDRHTQVFDNHGSRVAYNSGGSEETSICNPTIKYLHWIIATTIFTKHKSQSQAHLSEVFSHLVHSQGRAVWYGGLYPLPISLLSLPSQILYCLRWPHHYHCLCMGIGTPNSANGTFVRREVAQFGHLYPNENDFYGGWYTWSKCGSGRVEGLIMSVSE